MKVNIKENGTSAEIKSPCLMVSRKDGIVLFASECEGTVLKSSIVRVGYHSNLLDIYEYTPFTGTIELSND